MGHMKELTNANKILLRNRLIVGISIALFSLFTIGVEAQPDNKVIDIPVADGPVDIEYDPVHERMYVSDFLTPTLTVIDTITKTVIGSPINVSKNPGIGMGDTEYDPVNKRMYVTHFPYNVSVIDTTTNTVIGSPISVGDKPVETASNRIEYDPVNKRMYVSHSNLDSVPVIGNVSVIDTTTNTVIGSPISVRDGPKDIEYDPVNKRMYVTSHSNGTVTVIDTTTNTVEGHIPVG